VQGALAGVFLLVGLYSWSIKEWNPETIARLAGIRRLASPGLVCRPSPDIDRGKRPVLHCHGAKGAARGWNCRGAGHGHVLCQLSAVS